MKKRTLPGKGNYGVVSAWMQKTRIYTKSQVVAEFAKLGLSEKASLASAVVLLSPRKSSNRGDCRGNMSNPWGHLAYNEKLHRKAGEEQKFMFRWRVKAMAPHRRVVEGKVEAQKSSTKVTAKSPAKSKAQAKATV